MKSVLVRVRQYKLHASSAEQGVLEYILNDPESIPQLSIKELSARSFSSSSTIVRLCKKLNFEGYRDMQKSILYELAVRNQNENKSCSMEHANRLSDVIEQVTYRNISSLEDSMHLVEEEAVQKAVDMICESGSVLLFGLGASLLVAQDAYLKFLRIDKRCSCCEDIHSQYVLAKNANPNDVAIVISYSGCTEEILRCAEFLNAQGTPIIAITRFSTSPIAQLATCCLYVVATEELDRSGAMSSRISQLNMIDILYTACVNRNVTENTRHLVHNRIAKDVAPV